MLFVMVTNITRHDKSMTYYHIGLYLFFSLSLLRLT